MINKKEKEINKSHPPHSLELFLIKIKKKKKDFYTVPYSVHCESIRPQDAKNSKTKLRGIRSVSIISRIFATQEQYPPGPCKE